MVKTKNRLTTDALREVRVTFSRFLSILVLSALAVAFLAGLRTTAPDMEYTADNYYDRTHMMDGYVLSTLGITDDDLNALASLEGIETVEGAWSLDAVARDAVVMVGSLPQQLDLLEVAEGRLPQAEDECVTETMLLAELGLSIGDTLELTLEEDSADWLPRTSYTIVGVVNDPLYVGPDRGSSSLGTGTVDAYMYIPGGNFDMDYYTAAYFTFEGLADMDSYSDEYEDLLEERIDGMESFGDVRAQIRYDTLVGDAQAEIDDAQGQLDEARQELDDAKAEADEELSDGARELADARQELDDGWADYEEGRAEFEKEIRDAKVELANARTDLEEAEQELDEGRVKYADGLAEYEDGLAGYEDGFRQYEEGLAEYEAGLAEYGENKAELDGQQAAVDEGYAQYEAALAPYVGTPMYDMAVAQAAEEKARLDQAQAQLDAGYVQLAEAKSVLDEAKAALDETRAALDEAKAGLDEAGATLDDTALQLEEAEQAIADGWEEYHSSWDTLRREERNGQRELDDALAELEDGEGEYADGLVEYEDGRAEAEEKIADAEAELDDAQAEVDEAQAELDDIEECEWYILSRYTNPGFVSYAQDAERISNLANVFPIIFFLVAALACLTTMTRMVEEQRTQIGSLKAMGFSRWAISKKYIGYAFWASFVGGVLGLLVGGTLIPAVIANAFNIMYNIPPIQFKLQPGVCAVSVLAAVVCTTGAGLWACLSTLMDTPANLMRPKAPKAGKRVLLERVAFVWKRLSFTWKVTLRNLFRYKKRFWMTVIGIGGCTALIVTGFGLHESIFDILDKQFDEISLYDATVGLDEDITEEQWGEVSAYLGGSEHVDRFLRTHQETVDSSIGGLAQSTTLFVMEDLEGFRQFVDLRHRLDGEEVADPAGGVLITEKLSELLEAERGDTITLEHDERQVQVTVTDIVENYVTHYVYMTDELYQDLFGEAAAGNAVLLSYAEGIGQTESGQVSTRLMATDGVVSYSYIATVRDTFTESMNAVNYAVVIIILAAAALAFVVLYNLTNINITERTRELATLKVLGFYDGETTAYVYRENIFLTLFGILMGMGMGKFLHSFLVLTVEVDYVMFGRTAPPYAYGLAALLTVVFSVMVNIAAHFKLKKVDMVESLKTVE